MSEDASLSRGSFYLLLSDFRSFITTIPYEIHKIVSIVMAIIIEELTCPFINSYVPMQDNPNKVIPIDRQIICLAFEEDKFLEANIKTAIPSINIAVLRARTRLVIDGSSPNPLTNESDMKNSCENR